MIGQSASYPRADYHGYQKLAICESVCPPFNQSAIGYDKWLLFCYYGNGHCDSEKNTAGSVHLCFQQRLTK